MRSVFAIALAGLFLSGCYLAHRIDPSVDPPIDPPVDPPVDPPTDPPVDPPPRPAARDFVFLRVSEPGPFPIRPPDRWMHLRAGTWRATEILSVGTGGRLFDQRTNGGLGALRRSGRPGSLQWSGGPVSEPGLEGLTSIAEDGSSVLYFLPDEIVAVDRAGAPIGRWRVPGGGGVADPEHRWVVRSAPSVAPGEPPSQVTFLDLAASEQRVVTTPTPGVVRRAFFSESVVVLALVAAELGDDGGAPVTHELVTVDLASFETRLLDLSGLTMAAYDRCAERLLTIDDVGRVVAIDPSSGGRSIVGGPHGVMAYQGYPPFAALSALSPDGRHLVWLGFADDEERVLMVTDLGSGVSSMLDGGGVPPPWGCCDLVAIDATMGSFRDGYLSVGVGSRQLVPACSCTPVESPDPTAYRVQLEPAALVEVPHCGRSTPWMLDDGAMLVCEQDDAERVRLAIADEASLTTISDGPWDLGVQPLHRDDQLGCAAPW